MWSVTDLGFCSALPCWELNSWAPTTELCLHSTALVFYLFTFFDQTGALSKNHGNMGSFFQLRSWKILHSVTKYAFSLFWAFWTTKRNLFPLQSSVTYFRSGNPLKISLRLSSEIPFPRNTLVPSNSLAPFLHFPLISEYTETTSPAFITKERRKSDC